MFFDAAYCIRGDIKYVWDDGKSTASFQQVDVSDGDGCLILMDKNDPHELHSESKEGEALCVFYPPLKGTETHDFTKEGFSTY